MFSDPDIERLWHAGRLRAAYEESARRVVHEPTVDHPFRDPVALLAAARNWHEHGTLCWYLARFAESRALLERAYSVRASSLGDEHSDTLDTEERLAALSHYELAPDAPLKFGAVIDKLERVHGAGTVRVAIAERNCAAALRDRQNVAEARAMLDRARAILERGLPEADPEVIAAFKVSAMLHNIERKPEEAIRDAERAMALGARAWAPGHPHVAHAELTIVRAERRLDDLKKAVKRMPSIIERIERGLGNHPMLGLALAEYAQCELLAGRNFMRAEQLARRGIAVYAETYPSSARSMYWTLFEILFESRQIIEAGELALEIGAQLPRPFQLAMTSKIANHLVRLRDRAAALPWVERTRDLSDDPAVAAQWEEQAAHLRRLTR